MLYNIQNLWLLKWSVSIKEHFPSGVKIKVSQSFDSAKFWLHLWIECNQPQSSPIAPSALQQRKSLLRNFRTTTRKSLNSHHKKKTNKDNLHFLWSTLHPRNCEISISAANVPLSEWYLLWHQILSTRALTWTQIYWRVWLIFVCILWLWFYSICNVCDWCSCVP